MILATGNVFLHPVDILLVTTNAYVRSNGTLVMGRGAAKEATRYFAGCDRLFGTLIKDQQTAGRGGRAWAPYGVIMSALEYSPPWIDIPATLLDLEVERVGGGRRKARDSRQAGKTRSYYDPVRLGIFQVKYHWEQAAELDLIEYSTELLGKQARETAAVFSVNFPGIGNGRLKREDVLPIIQQLPDNVLVWTKV